MLGIFRRIHTMRGIDKFHKLFGRGISHMWGCTMWRLPETERQKVKTLSHMYVPGCKLPIISKYRGFSRYALFGSRENLHKWKIAQKGLGGSCIN